LNDESSGGLSLAGNTTLAGIGTLRAGSKQVTNRAGHFTGMLALTN